MNTLPPRRLPLCAILVAWLLATGSQWDLVQTFAWGRMITTYTRAMPLAQAVRLTFTPSSLCGVCEAVDESRRRTDDAPVSAGREPAKIVLFHQPGEAARVVNAQIERTEGGPDLRPRGRDRAKPPVPPPRAA